MATSFGNTIEKIARLPLNVPAPYGVVVDERGRPTGEPAYRHSDGLYRYYPEEAYMSEAETTGDCCTAADGRSLLQMRMDQLQEHVMELGSMLHQLEEKLAPVSTPTEYPKVPSQGEAGPRQYEQEQKESLVKSPAVRQIEGMILTAQGLQQMLIGIVHRLEI